MDNFTIFLVLIVIVAFLLVVVIMVQNPKGGGLSSAFGGSGTQQLGGVKKTGDFLDKSTWALATLLIALILLSNFAIPGVGGVGGDSKALDPDATTTQPLPDNSDTQPLQENTTTPADSTSN